MLPAGSLVHPIEAVGLRSNSPAGVESTSSGKYVVSPSEDRELSSTGASVGGCVRTMIVNAHRQRGQDDSEQSNDDQHLDESESAVACRACGSWHFDHVDCLDDPVVRSDYLDRDELTVDRGVARVVVCPVRLTEGNWRGHRDLADLPRFGHHVALRSQCVLIDVLQYVPCWCCCSPSRGHRSPALRLRTGATRGRGSGASLDPMRVAADCGQDAEYNGAEQDDRDEHLDERHRRGRGAGVRRRAGLLPCSSLASPLVPFSPWS